MKELSGKFVVRVEPRLHALLRRASEKKGISLNQFCSNELGRAVLGVAPEDDLISFGLPVHRILKAIQGVGFPLQGVLLFGSVSRGEATASSDIDLLLVLPPGTPLSRELYTQWDVKVGPALKDLGPHEYSPQFVTLPQTVDEAGGIWFEVALEGILLWEASTAIASFLSRLRTEIAEGRIVRQTSHGHPFWIRTTEGTHEK